MDVSREFAKTPPREPLDTLAALVRDFRWRFPRERRDMVVEYCRAAPTLEEAIYRAVMSKAANGKHHNHQSKIVNTAYMPMIHALNDRQEAIDVCFTFDELHDLVHDIHMYGWGPVGIYDIATRIGAFLGMEPESVYLHAGVRKGAVALGLNVRGKDRLTNDGLPAALAESDLTGDEIEDFLCTYRGIFADLKDEG